MYGYNLLIGEETVAEAKNNPEPLVKAFHCTECDVLWRDKEDFSTCWACGETVYKTGRQVITGKE